MCRIGMRPRVCQENTSASLDPRRILAKSRNATVKGRLTFQTRFDHGLALKLALFPGCGLLLGGGIAHALVLLVALGVPPQRVAVAHEEALEEVTANSETAALVETSSQRSANESPSTNQKLVAHAIPE